MKLKETNAGLVNEFVTAASTVNFSWESLEATGATIPYPAIAETRPSDAIGIVSGFGFNTNAKDVVPEAMVVNPPVRTLLTNVNCVDVLWRETAEEVDNRFGESDTPVVIPVCQYDPER